MTGGCDVTRRSNCASGVDEAITVPPVRVGEQGGWNFRRRNHQTNFPMKALTLCGSLRARSSNRAVLRAYERLAPPSVTFVHFEGIGTLPHFNPDLDDERVPEEVVRFRAQIAAADVIVVSTPEYVHALPGSFK